MKKYRMTSCFSLANGFLCLLLFTSLLEATPKKFPKISFLEPYVYLKNTPESTQALTYYGQMESCGVNIIVGLLDPRTSPLATAFQYYNNQAPKTANGVSLFAIGGGDNAAIFQAEKTSPGNYYTDGYYFNPTTGAPFTGDEGGQTDGWWGQAGVDAAGYLMTGLAGCLKSCIRRPDYKLYYPKFRLKVPTNSLPGTTPVCSLFLRVGYDLQLVAQRLLILSDFTSPGNYQEFEIFGASGDVSSDSHGSIDLQVKWLGNVNLYVDRVDFMDGSAKIHLELPAADVQNAFSSYYGSIDTARQLRWYRSDELWPSNYRLEKWFDNFSTVIGPKGKTTSEIPYDYTWNLYFSELQALELNHNVYPFPVGYDSSSSALHNIQHKIDSIYLPVLIKARQTAAQRGIPYHPMIQAVGQFDTLGNPVGVRDPQRPEIYAQVFLALAYGAKGIGYFTYTTVYHKSPLARLIKEIPPDSMGEVTGPYPPSSYPALHGLVDWNSTTRRFEPNYKWYAVRHADSILDKIGPVLLDLTWDTAKIANSSIRYLDSVKSAQFSTPYIEAGFFKDSVNTDYFMLVNRRVLSSEGQDVTAWLNKSGHSYVIDMFTGDTVLTGNIGTGAPFSTHLNPGEGKLFKVVSAPQYINGSSFPLTWQGKITIDGDVTVSSGKTLKILPPQAKLSFLARKDTLHTGQDVNRSELLINGSLRANGTSGDQVKFVSASTTPDTNDWYGIWVSGSAKLQHCIIRHAYTGISYGTFSADTMKNVQIARCKLYGVWLSISPNVVIQNCRIDSINANPGGTGIYIDPYYNTGSGRLIKDTIRACYYGVYAYEGKFPIDSCIIIGPGNTGIVCDDQVQFDTSQRVPITATKITGYFSGQLFLNASNGWANLSGCDLVSDTSPRSPYGIRSSDIWTYLKLRKTKVIDWGSVGVSLRHNSSQIANLGIDDILFPDSGLNNINTSKPTWDEETGKTIFWWYVKDQDCISCSTPVIKAELNYWGSCPPPSTRFSGNIDRTPCMNSAPPKLVAGDGGTEILPQPTDLFQNYPNPFNPTTLIQFNLEKAEKVNLEIFNILGQRVRTLLSGEGFAAGPYTFLWDGRDDRGGAVSSGMYIYRLQTPTYLKTKKMMLVK